MNHLIIMPWGRTDWGDQGRLIGGTNLPLNAAGRAAVAALIDQLHPPLPEVIHFGPEEAARETAQLAARKFGLRARRPTADLREPSLGVWEGLTLDQVEQRFNRAYDQWRTHPQSFCPPEGEPVADAAARLQTAVERIVQRAKKACGLFVVGPMAAAALRCQLMDGSLENFWPYLEHALPMLRLNWPPPSAPPASPAPDAAP